MIKPRGPTRLRALILAAIALAACSDSTGPGKLSDSSILFIGQSAFGDLDPAIWAVLPDGSGLRKITTGLGQALYPRWSRDGQRIAYVTIGPSSIETWVMRKDHSDAHAIAGTDQCFNGFLRLTWSPTGDRVIGDCGDSQTVINVDDLSTYSLSDRWGKLAGKPDWSPVDDRILYGAGADTWVANLDGSQASLLLPSASEATWSPDGRSIAFVRNGDRNSAVFVAKADGTGVRQLSFPQSIWVYDGSPAWSHDSRRIVYVRDDETNRSAWFLHVVGADGAADRIITPDTLFATHPDW